MTLAELAGSKEAKMAMVNCKECNAQISDQASACPQCGAKPKKTVGIAGYIVAGILLVFVMKAAWREDPPKETRSPQEVALAKAREKAYQDRLGSTMTVLTTIKLSLRDPASVQWLAATSNETGGVVCVSYRAKNGFGGMNVEYAAYGGGAISTDEKHYRQYCDGKSMHNMKSAFTLVK